MYWHQAHAFRSVTAQATIYFPTDYFGKWIILFSYSTSTTSIHHAEFLTRTSRRNNFGALNCERIGLPVHSLQKRIAGFNSIKKKIGMIFSSIS